jgi:hypothetical protein
MKFTPKRLALAIASAGLLTIYGCGGGGSSAASTTFSGTAATGAPFVGASVVVTDATGATAGTATTADDGSYTLNFDPTKFTAPFVVTVTGTVGNAEEKLVSVQPTSSSSTVNITPITHAIAALMSGTGNPLDLVANIATDKANITTTNIADVEKGFRDALASNITAMGLDPATVNLISTTFSAKLDKLLDNVKVEVTSTGEIKMSTSAGSTFDDLGNTGTTPTAAKVVELAKGVKPTAALATNLPAAGAGETPIGIDAIEAGRLALNACFALPVATRYSSGTYASQCANLVTTSYKNEGRTAAQEFGTTGGLIGDSGNDGMVFQKPEILRQLSATPNRERLVVRLSAKRADGQMRELTTVAENNPTGYTGWQLVGNQRDFETFVNGVATNRISVNTPANNRYETGLNLYVGTSTSISSVVVTGPGLTSAITLKPKTGCDFLTIVPTVGTDPNANTNTGGTAWPCSSLYRVRSLKTDGTTFTPSGNTHLFGSLTDTDIQAIKPLDLYKYVITKTDLSTVTYWNRLRSRPLTVAEMALVKYVDFSAAAKAMMTTGTLYAGGTAPTINWTVPANAPRPFLAYFFHVAGSDRIGVPFSSTSATIPCSGNSECSGSQYVTTLTTGLTATSQYGFQAVSRNRFDTQIFTQLWR